ncbi:hypothetical protein DRQ33_04995 [bacterium]|nr:MAG: hypothetical protein DRQ33_04995 [bacterium]
MSDPKKIDGLVKNVLKELELWDTIQGNRLFIEWEELVGENLAKYIVPVKFIEENGELWLGAKDPIWRTQLFNIRESLISSLNEKLNDAVIKKIRIVDVFE